MIADDEQQEQGRSGAFDPRYDPAFQRGYRPTPGERTRTRVRSLPLETGSAQPSRARRERIVDDDLDEPVPAEAAALTIAPLPAPEAFDEPRVSAAVTIVPASGVLDRVELSPRRNPLMLALWIVGAGFVVLGIVLYCISVSVSYSGPTPSSDVGSLVFAQLGWMLAGPLITVGLVTLVGLLFLTALAARRRPAEPEEPEGPEVGA